MKLICMKSIVKAKMALPLLVCAVVWPSNLHAEVFEKKANGTWGVIATSSEKQSQIVDKLQSHNKKEPLRLVQEDNITTESQAEDRQTEDDKVAGLVGSQSGNTQFQQDYAGSELNLANTVYDENIEDIKIGKVEIIGLEPLPQFTSEAPKQTEKTNKVKKAPSKNYIARSKRKKRSRLNIKGVERKKAFSPDAVSRAFEAAGLQDIRKQAYGQSKIEVRRNNFLPIILAAAQQYKLDFNLIDAIMWQESRYRDTSRSHVGAIGLMQLMPGTARELGVDPYDNWQNVFGGAAYFRQQLDYFNGDITLALAAYNAGPGAVKRYRGVPPYTETKKYVKAIIKRYNINKLNDLYSENNSKEVISNIINNVSLYGRDRFATGVMALGFNSNLVNYRQSQRLPQRKRQTYYVQAIMYRSEQTKNQIQLPYRKV